MPYQLFKSRAWLVFLAMLVFGLSAFACGSGGKPAALSSRPVPSPGSTPELAAQQILDLAIEASASVVSFRAEGGFLSYEPDLIKEPESATMVVEWTVPCRLRQTVHQDQGSGIVESQVIVIGNSVFVSTPFQGDPQWREHRDTRGPGADGLETSERSESPANKPFRLSTIVLDDTVEVIELNGTVVYKINGIETPPNIDLPENVEQEMETRVSLFIDAATFLVFRDERVMTARSVTQIRDSSALDGTTGRVNENVIEFSLDYTYSGEPLVIEPPENFIPYNDGDGGPDASPTPYDRSNLPTPTPTAVPAPVRYPTSTPAPVPFATFAPDDPNRNIPFFIYEEPYYNKMELGNDVVVSFPPCNYRNSLGHRAFKTAIFYMVDGSMAANGAWYSSSYDPENPDAFSTRRFHSEAGRKAVEAVLNDAKMMARIIEYTDRNIRCPAEFLSYTGDTFDGLPGSDKFRIDGETIARFESCTTTGVNLAAPVLIAHTSSRTVVAVDSVDQFVTITWSEDGGDKEDFWTLVRDKSLLGRLLALAPREVRCG